jgi:hypothetical protein
MVDSYEVGNTMGLSETKERVMVKQITVADVTDADLELFSDLFKECYDVRPHFTPTKEDFVNLANRYDAIQADRLAEEHRCLEYAAQAERVFAERNVARLEAAAIVKPGIKQVIDCWEHGDI